MAAIQSEMGEKAVTALVAMFPPEDEGEPPEVHFEAFQVSAQCKIMGRRMVPSAT